jgi:hypothetical protein
MDDQARYVFFAEIKRQSAFAIRAARDLEIALETLDNERVWFDTQAILVAAAIVSRILFPAKKDAQARGVELRQATGTGDGSALADRKLRNHIEHFDERLDTWVAQSSGWFIDANISPGSASQLVRPSAEGASALRHFDSEAIAIEFRDERYELKPLLEEMARVCRVVAPMTPGIGELT